MQKKECPVVIVGAGLTGLIAAYTLKKRGIEACILEKTDRIGGRVDTLLYADGATAEAHMEEFWERTPIYPLLKELNLTMKPSLAQHAIRFQGRYITHFGELDKFLPQILTPSEIKEYLQWNDEVWELYQELKATHFSGKALTPRLQQLRNIRFIDWIKTKLSPHACELVRILIEPEIGIEIEHLAALDGIDEMRIFLNTTEGFGETSYHIEHGNHKFIEALAKQLPADSILMERNVIEVVQKNGGVEVTCTGAAGRIETLFAKCAMIAVPLFCINSIQFDPPLDSERQKAIDTIHFGSYIKILHRVEQVGIKSWAELEKKLDGKIFPLISGTNAGTIYMTNILEEPTAQANDLVLTLLVCGLAARKWMAFNEEEIAHLSLVQMDELFPNYSSFVSSIKVYKYPTAVACWPIAFGRSRFDDLAQLLRQPFGKVLIGTDTTEDSHAEGAALAALRMAQQAIEVIAKLEGI